MVRHAAVLYLALVLPPVCQAQITEQKVVPRWTDARRTLELPARPLTFRAAAALLSAGTGYRVSYLGPPRRITPRIGQAGFWEALVRFCGQAGLDFQQWPDRRITLEPAVFRLAGWQRIGPYLAVLTAPVPVDAKTWQIAVRLDRLQLGKQRWPLSLTASAWQLILPGGKRMPLKEVRRRETTWRLRIQFQVQLNQPLTAPARVEASLMVRYPAALRVGTLALSGRRLLTDAALGLNWTAGRPEGAWGGATRIPLALRGGAGKASPSLQGARLVLADGSSVGSELITGAAPHWTLRFPRSGGEAAGLRISYVAHRADHKLALQLGGLRFELPPAPARRIAGSIRITSPPEGPAQLSVGFRRREGEHHGEMISTLDLHGLGKRDDMFREDGLLGHIRWRGAAVAYALDRLTPGRYVVWVRYRKNLMVVRQVTVPASGTQTIDWTLDCSKVTEFRARFQRPPPVEGKKVEVLRVFFLPLSADGSPALASYRDAVASRIEKDGRLIVPFLGLGRYRILALNETRPRHPFLIETSFTVDGKTRPTWVLPGK